jgi:hypothetical protein
VPDFKIDNDDFEKSMTDWPPLYPALLSFLISDRSPETSISLFNAIALSALAIFFTLCIFDNKNYVLSFVCVLILLFHTPIITVYTYAWSETLFLPLLMTAYFFTMQYKKCQDIKYLSFSILALIASCYTRYVGILFLLPLILMLLSGKEVLRKKIMTSALVCTITLLALAPLYLWIFYFKRSSMAPREKSPDDFFTNLATVGDLLGQHLLGISSWYACGVIIVLVMAGMLFFVKKREKNSDIANVDYLFGIVWPLIWAIIYLLILVVLRTWKDFDVLDTRLICPAIIFIVLALAGSIKLASQHMHNASVKWILVSWGVGLLILGISSYSIALNGWRNQTSPSFKMNDQAEYSNFTAHPGFLWMVDLYDKIKLLTKNENPIIVFDGSGSMIFKHLTNAKVKWLPSDLNDPLIDKINKKGDGVVIAMTPAGMATLTSYYGSNVHDMSALPELMQYGILVIKLPLPTKKLKIK